MAIITKATQIHLKTNNTSYILCVDQDKWLLHLYWGKALSEDIDLTHCPNDEVYPRPIAFQVPVETGNINVISDLQMEYSTMGYGDYRIPAFHARYSDESSVTRFTYKGCKIFEGKRHLEGLPSIYAQEGDKVQTVEIEMADDFTGLHAYLTYNVFEEFDVITRSVRYENQGSGDIHILSAQSAIVDLFPQQYKMLDLYGEWAHERNMEWTSIGHGIFGFDSKRGMSSHMHNPCITLATKNVDENTGELYSMSLVYSGDFEAKAERSSCGGVRMSIGINSFDFDWHLRENEVFQTPEAVMVYANGGLNTMSGIYHKIYRQRLCRGKYRDQIRPLLINSWEGLGGNVSEEKIRQLALKAKEIGCEMLVIDSGWFENSEFGGVGDWITDQTKFPNGLGEISDFLRKENMKFGIWFEPEMANIESKVYANHPDWCIHCEGREVITTHHRVVLDLSKIEVQEYIIEKISRIVDAAKVDYIKWDCNRNIVETQTTSQKHQFVLGLYKILETLTQKYPNILFESCSGGGGRFDAGLLYYMPQVWTSDNTRAIDRMKIQYGTSVYYPSITMGAHIGVLDMGYERYNDLLNSSALVSMAGNFGFEFDLTNLSEKESMQAKEYTEIYKQIRKTVQFGSFYRIESPFESEYASWMFTDQDYAVLFTYQRTPQENGEERRIKLVGLDEDSKYQYKDRIYTGEELTEVGLRIPLGRFDYDSKCFVFKKING